jgi:hypothetical protein
MRIPCGYGLKPTEVLPIRWLRSGTTLVASG